MQARSQDGFSVMELLTVTAMIGLLAAIALPESERAIGDYRLRGDARNLHNAVGLAKMRAASKYTRSRVFVDLTTHSFTLQDWDKTSSTWVTEEDAVSLSNGVVFSTSGVASPPPDTQSTLGQSPACLDDDGATAIANTACVVFNSRGIPIDAAGAPTGNSAFYFTDGETGVYAVTVSATPLLRLWWSPADHTTWIHR
jgi:prepilin-type N-terminal cleavage/methylation domain-containing protein